MKNILHVKDNLSTGSRFEGVVSSLTLTSPACQIECPGCKHEVNFQKKGCYLFTRKVVEDGFLDRGNYPTMRGYYPMHPLSAGVGIADNRMFRAHGVWVEFPLLVLISLSCPIFSLPRCKITILTLRGTPSTFRVRT